MLGFFIFTMASLGLVSSSYGQEPAITDFTVTNSENSLLLYLTVKDWMTEEIAEAVHNGIPITLTFYVDLFVVRNNWPDKKVKEYEFNHVMEYDSLKKEYIVHRNENEDRKVTDSPDDAIRVMSEINGFKVLPLNELDPNASYLLRAKTKMARNTMPPYFHYLIPFSSPWDFETDWYKLTLKLAL
jgi:Domain of unknown function (DUF4390)